MPEVFIRAILISGELKVRENLLLNSGARGIELAIKESVAKKLRLRPHKKAKVYPIGPVIEGDIAYVEIAIKNPETGERRKSLLEAVILSDKVLDCSLIGVIGQEKLGIIPDTFTGKVIFK